MLLSSFIKESTAALSSLYPEPEARNIILMLCSAILGTKSYTHITEPSTQVAADRLPSLQAALSRLCNAEPIQYVLGECEFCDRVFRVSPAVLIPRPETEMLAMECARMAREMQKSDPGRPVRVLDMCTGSGCIAWTIALSAPGVQVVGVDISGDALAVASAQDFADECRRTGAFAPAFVKADVLKAPELEGPFDLIVSNPPYIMDSERQAMRRNVLEYEPSLALFVPDSDPLLFYRAVAFWATSLLAADGSGMVEANELLGDSTLEAFISAGFGNSEKIDDFFGKFRFVRFSR